MVEVTGLSLHDTIRQQIEERIMSGEWAPGFRIPYEHQFMEQYGCSRMTVNKALSTLVEKGLIDRRKRAGTFVAAPQVHRAALDIPDIRAEVLASHHRYDFQLVSRAERSASDSDKAQLSIEAGPVLALSCVHYADGLAHALEERLVNLALVPEARSVDFSKESPGSWLLAHVPWGDARHRITAVAADQDVAARLAIPVGHACMSVERWTWRLPQRITYVRLIYPGDQYALEAHFRP